MTLRHMKILVEVYRQNSVTKAAQALHLSQPSVSLALRELEDYYGVTLFERVGRRISPTECGREFYGYAVHVVSLMDELETRMRNWDAIGTVRIGATVTIGTYLLPELVRRYQAEFPALHAQVQVCPAGQVEQLAIHTFFMHFTQLGLCGGTLRVDGKLAAFTLGERINSNTLCVHIEKGDLSFNGVYPAINYYFANHVDDPAIQYVNREDDLGLPGLRKSKLSYHPAFLLEKYRLVQTGFHEEGE